MWEYQHTDTLCHYGVLGMKWGVRRKRKGVATRKAKKSSEDKAVIKRMKNDSKNRRLLTDAELDQKIKRIKMEKELRNLTAEEVTPGKKAVGDILGSAGKKAATIMVTGAILYGVKAAMTKNFDVKDAAGYVTPKPKTK